MTPISSNCPVKYMALESPFSSKRRDSYPLHRPYKPFVEVRDSATQTGSEYENGVRAENRSPRDVKNIPRDSQDWVKRNGDHPYKGYRNPESYHAPDSKDWMRDRKYDSKDYVRVLHNGRDDAREWVRVDSDIVHVDKDTGRIMPGYENGRHLAVKREVESPSSFPTDQRDSDNCSVSTSPHSITSPTTPEPTEHCKCGCMDSPTRDSDNRTRKNDNRQLATRNFEVHSASVPPNTIVVYPQEVE